MKTKAVSSYKSAADKQFVGDWIKKVQTLNNSFYEKVSVHTSFGETIVHTFNRERGELEPLFILPGARTFGMYWDLNDNLKPLKRDFRLYLVDVIGQPGLSSGNSPDVKTDEFGRWICEVLDALSLDKTNVAGASFGGLLSMKLANVAPERILKMILMNPIGLSYISLAPSSLFNNLLPIISPSLKTVNRFLDKIILGGAENLTGPRREMLAEIILQTLQKFNFKADYPYKMGESELTGWSVPTYLIVGDRDGLIPYRKTVQLAEKHVKNLKEVHILKNIGHGIELAEEPMRILADILKTTDETPVANLQREKVL